MEEWENVWSAVMADVSALFDEVGREVTELVEEIATEAQEILNLSWDELKEVLAELWQEFELEFEDINPVTWDIPTPTPPQANPATHPACVGCVHYNGTAYGGNLLVCGMHPYGCEGDMCVDWEGEGKYNVK
jgi:hypothetical protein